MISIETKSVRETQKVARLLARELRLSPNGAMIVALIGELGAGKTTFVQGFAATLGVKERVQSPTFVLMKIYGLGPRIKDKSKKIKSWGKEFRRLIHIDCYRLASPKELLHLGFKEIVKDKDAIILIEWADRVKKILPRHTIWFYFEHGLCFNQRTIMTVMKIRRQAHSLLAPLIKCSSP